MSTNISLWSDLVNSLRVDVSGQFQRLDFIFNGGRIEVNDLVCEGISLGDLSLHSRTTVRHAAYPHYWDGIAEALNVSASGVNVTCSMMLNMTTLQSFTVYGLGSSESRGKGAAMGSERGGQKNQRELEREEPPAYVCVCECVCVRVC